MRKKYMFLGVIILVFIIGVITNPTKEEYISWSKEEWVSNADNELVKWGLDILGDGLISAATDTNNFVLFSIYTTTVSETNTFKVLGIFKNFIPLSSPSETVSATSTKSTQDTIQAAKPVLNENEESLATNLFMLDNKLDPINNTKSFRYPEDNKELAIKLKNGKTKISFGKDHPNGIQITLIKENKATSIELTNVQEGILDEFGDLADIDNFSLQIGTHDFNKDGIEELIIAIGDGLVEGQLWVYSYHKVDDITKISPFYLELTTYFQNQILIEDETIALPYGSQGLFESYVWHKGQFIQSN